jgi:dCMP deaminase
MSIHDDLCDLCGAYVDPIGGDAALASGSTQRLWCGTCHTNSRKDVIHWLYSTNAQYPIEEETKTETMTAPIKRPTWDDYYLGIAKAVSTRGDCVRRQHGAVIVKNHSIIATGYNGSPPGSDKSCGATGQCPRNLDPNSKHGEGSYDLCWATHAEANAIVRASWEDLQGSTIYITGSPCPGCSKLIASAGIDRVVFPDL